MIRRADFLFSTLILNCALIVFLTAPARGAGEVSVYAVIKDTVVKQTDVAVEAPGGTPNHFDARVLPTSNGSVTGATVTLPAGSTATSPQALSATNDGTGSYGFTAKFADQATLDANYKDGSYALSITGASSTVYNAALFVSGGVYPSETPIVSNTGWSGGNLIVDPSAAFTLNWNSFASGTGASDRIFLDIRNIGTGQSLFLQFLPSTTTSQSFGANFFQPNQSYDVGLGFVKVTSLNTEDISGATGYGGFGNEDSFTIQTIPEPSTLVLATAGFLLLSALTIRRSRRYSA